LATFETWSPDEASIRQLVARLMGEGRALLADVAGLLGAEARGRVADLRGGAVLLASAGGTLLVGLAVASAAAVAALALAIPLWAAALLVAAVELALAFVLVRLAITRLRRMATPPEQTLEVLEKGVRLLRAEADASAARRAALSQGAHAPSHRLGEPPS
jgi:Putative Actinobacterial Holin-X, holin superfamily III